MKAEKANNVLQALQRDRIDSLTKESLIRAFNDDGIFDLEAVAECMVKRIQAEVELLKTGPRVTDFSLVGTRTPPELARSIVHVVPEIPFMLDGVAYDPADIRRFDGQSLVSIPFVAADGSNWL